MALLGWSTDSHSCTVAPRPIWGQPAIIYIGPFLLFLQISILLTRLAKISQSIIRDRQYSYSLSQTLSKPTYANPNHIPAKQDEVSHQHPPPYPHGRTALAMPAPEAEPLEERAATLEKRQSCKRVRRFWPDQKGVCVDTRGAHPCDGGALYTGLCPNTPNHIICCIN